MKLVPEAKGPVSRRFIADIIESRMSEIFELVNAELKSLGKYAELPGGVVVVGGGAKLPGTLISPNRKCAFPRRSVRRCRGVGG